MIADDYILETAIQEGLAEKLDKDSLENIGNINPLYQDSSMIQTMNTQFLTEQASR